MTSSGNSGQQRQAMSALPSQAARALAFASIVVGGLAGAVIGYGIVKVQCSGTCTTQKAAGSIVGALFIGVGIAVVAVLVLRAMGEWNAIKEREAGVALGSRTSLRVPLPTSLTTSGPDSSSPDTDSIVTPSNAPDASEKNLSGPPVNDEPE